MKYKIYLIENIKTGKYYIGITSKSLKERLQRHFRSSSYGSNVYLHKSMKKYGFDNFIISLLEETDNWNDEIRYIKEHNTLVPNGYNITKGGTGGDTSASNNFIQSMKNRNMNGNNNPMFGKLAKENPNFGSKRSDKQKENIRLGTTKSWDSNRKKAASIRFSGKNNPQAKKIYYNDKVYNTIKEAANENNTTCYSVRKNGTLL